MNINNVTFGYNNNSIIKDFSLNVSVGSNIMILGDNGSGKSTLGKLFCGIFKPQTGSILINNTHVYKLKSKKRISSAYYITQLNHLQIINNTILKEINQVEKLVSKKYSLQDYNTFYLPEDLASSPLELTTNQAWRFSLFLADLINPKVLFIDEIVSSVNQLNNVVLYSLLEKRKLENKITFVSYQRIIDFPFDLSLSLHNGELITLER